jgi:hypothetical protein
VQGLSCAAAGEQPPGAGVGGGVHVVPLGWSIQVSRSCAQQKICSLPIKVTDLPPSGSRTREAGPERGVPEFLC